MTDTLKNLGGGSSPVANTLTALYTVPAATSATVSSVVACNTTVGPVTFRISVAPAGAADAISQYLYYDQPLAAKDTFVATIGLTLATTDVIRVEASSTGVAFNVFGVEVT